MNISNVILHLFPNASPITDFIVQDDSDGNGPYIAQWNLDAQKPTSIELQNAWDIMNGFNLDKYKEENKQYLEQLADSELQHGFSSTVNETDYFFIYDAAKAQPRFTKQATEVAIYPDPSAYPPIDQIEWATDKGFQTFTREQFIGILKDLASHEKTISFKLLYAQAHIDNATTKEDVDSVVASW